MSDVIKRTIIAKESLDSREAIAKHLFVVMNKGRFSVKVGIDCVTGRIYRTVTEEEALDSMWKWYKTQGFDEGYLRLADETVCKGYKP